MIELIQNNRLDPDAQTVREVFLKHGTEQLFEKSEEPAGGVNSLDLEFPDWTGMDDSSARITPAAAFRLCEQYPLLISKPGSKGPHDRPEKCMAEFVL